jgi:hypothetical protein
MFHAQHCNKFAEIKYQSRLLPKRIVKFKMAKFRISRKVAKTEKVRKDLNGHLAKTHNPLIYMKLSYNIFASNCPIITLFAVFAFFTALREIKNDTVE